MNVANARARSDRMLIRCNWLGCSRHGRSSLGGSLEDRSTESSGLVRQCVALADPISGGRRSEGNLSNLVGGVSASANSISDEWSDLSAFSRNRLGVSNKNHFRALLS